MIREKCKVELLEIQCLYKLKNTECWRLINVTS